MLRRRAAVSPVIEFPIEREETLEIMAGLMRIQEKLDTVTSLLGEDVDGEEEEEDD